jgi:hypothetical protein
MFHHPEINPTVITLIWTDAFLDGKLRFCVRWEFASAVFLRQRYGSGGLPSPHRYSDSYRLRVDPMRIHSL